MHTQLRIHFSLSLQWCKHGSWWQKPRGTEGCGAQCRFAFSCTNCGFPLTGGLLWVKFCWNSHAVSFLKVFYSCSGATAAELSNYHKTVQPTKLWNTWLFKEKWLTHSGSDFHLWKCPLFLEIWDAFTVMFVIPFLPVCVTFICNTDFIWSILIVFSILVFIEHSYSWSWIS